MRKVAVFGNAGGGKSTLAGRLSEITGLPLYVLDIIAFPDGRYRPDCEGGGQLDPAVLSEVHRDILARDRWIIDGYGSVSMAWERFSAADTLVYVDLPVSAHYWGVTKRLVAGLLARPKGWPAHAPVWASSLNSYRVIPQCHRLLTPRYRRLVAEMASSKTVHHLRSRAAVAEFLRTVDAGETG